MAEQPITAAVGAQPAANNPDDVRLVQTMLNAVAPPLRTRVTASGSIDDATIRAIREFQGRFMATPDGRVDPDGRTIWHLNDGFVSQYIGCSPAQRRVIDRDIINAQKWLDTVIGRLSPSLDADAKRKVRNIFHIDADNTAHASRRSDLLTRYRRLRSSMDESFPLQCERRGSLFAAYVDLNDPAGTMHFPPGHFNQAMEQRTETIIHERAHTVFHISHGGMSGAGELDFGRAPDDDNGYTYEEAIANAYCYGWLATSLQPGYVPPESEVIVVPRR